MTRAVAVAVATTAPDGSTREASRVARSPSRWTTRPRPMTVRDAQVAGSAHSGRGWTGAGPVVAFARSHGLLHKLPTEFCRRALRRPSAVVADVSPSATQSRPGYTRTRLAVSQKGPPMAAKSTSGEAVRFIGVRPPNREPAVRHPTLLPPAEALVIVHLRPVTGRVLRDSNSWRCARAGRLR
jgi:hypothetical protein